MVNVHCIWIPFTFDKLQVFLSQPTDFTATLRLPHFTIFYPPIIEDFGSYLHDISSSGRPIPICI